MTLNHIDRMRIKYLLAVLLLFTDLMVLGNPAPNDFEVIKKRVAENLLSYRSDDARVEMILKTFRADSTWPGINYADVTREGFEHREHYGNMVSLARAWKTPGSEYFKSKKVLSTLSAALGLWVRKDFFCDNWWYNQIGTPDNLVTVMLLAGDRLPKEIVDKAQPIIGRANLNASGARPSGDRIKIAGILAKNLLFTGNKEQFDQVIKVIEGEIKFSTGSRGMQHDFSFHHREDRVNNTNSYGTGYADAFAEWAAYVAGTRYAFSEGKINQLIDYYLDGICKQMVYGKIVDPGARNRDISRADGSARAGTTALERLIKASDYRKAELEQIIRIRKGEASTPISYGKFFWQTEYYTHQRPGYFTSVRMFSTRNRNMEQPYNSEGLKNHHRGDGTNYLSLRGDEYLNIAPVFDWQKIPGATILQKAELPPPEEIQKDGLTGFVGAVTDGLYGAVTFDFKSPHDPLAARKSWFFFDKEYVCLGAGISSGNNLPVVTTMNQCLLKGAVTVSSGTQETILPPGNRQIDHVNWVFHDGVGYLYPKPVKLNVSNQTEKGSWFSINKQSDSPKEEVSLDVFKLWIDHGKRLSNTTYEYVVIPGATLQDMMAAGNRSVEILSNTPALQAVRHTGLQILQAVFYRAGEIQLSAQTKLVCDQPGIVMVKMNGSQISEISVADPNRELWKFHLSVSGKWAGKSGDFTAVWNEKSGMTDISAELPKDVYEGQSITLKL
jgi:chondroitin AC lyase